LGFILLTEKNDNSSTTRMKNTAFYSSILLICISLLLSCSPEKESAQTAAAETAVASDSAAKNSIAPQATTQTILFFGNSLTAGYGLDPAQAFPALIQKKIDSLNLPYKVVNAGLSGETSAGGKARISWVLRQPVDIFVLELGANDGLRGIELTNTRKNLQAILDSVKTRNPDVQLVIAGMQMPPNLGPKYTSDFRALFPSLSEQNNATLIPFLLDRVAGVATLNQPDGIHPTAEGHRLVAENVWKVLRPLLEQNSISLK